LFLLRALALSMCRRTSFYLVDSAHSTEASITFAVL
jgi:hypothetical protein